MENKGTHMNSLQAFDAIEQIAATSSKNEKQALVAEYVKDGDFEVILRVALDPLVSFGIARRPVTTGNGTAIFDDATWTIINQLEARNLTGDAAISAVTSELERLDPKSSELFWRILKKDLRAGFGAETVNKVSKGLIKAFPYMRCVLPADAQFNKWDWAA